MVWHSIAAGVSHRGATPVSLAAIAGDDTARLVQSGSGVPLVERRFVLEDHAWILELGTGSASFELGFSCGCLLCAAAFLAGQTGAKGKSRSQDSKATARR